MAHQLVTDEHGALVIDVRGPRFGAAITTLVLAVALIVQGPVGVALVAWQWVAFAIATFAGLRWSPYGNLFRALKRRLDLGPPPATEPEGPPRFAQLCGFAVTSIALVAFAFGATAIAKGDTLVMPAATSSMRRRARAPAGRGSLRRDPPR
jgi:hypothetical protein